MNGYKLPIGVSNFYKLVSNGYLFCDKTAMIADFLNKGDEVTLITRPRRWGKTLNISTLIYPYLFKSDKVNELQLEQLYVIRKRQANQQALEKSLKLLSQCLYQHHGQKVYILIDEYDTPLNKVYSNQDYLNAMVAFMRNLFSAALKENTTLERGVLTGILRVSKDSMLSGLNNLKTYTLLDQGYSSHFGLSEIEVQDLFTKQNLTICLDQVKSWYNGYRVGNLVMYNPWSIIYCLSEEGRFDVYWVNTGNNDCIKQLLISANDSIKAKFEQLMQGEALTVPVDKHLAFDLLNKDETALWSLLLFAGYLTFQTSNLSLDSDLYDCIIKVPNNEIRRLYNRFFTEWLSSKFMDQGIYNSFLDHLVSGNVSCFTQALSFFLLQSASCFDTHSSRKSEGFYHGFVLAMLASLGRTHYVKSNRESGLGRYDMLLIPKEDTNALLLEFKHVRKEEELENAAKLALAQIQAQAYRTEILQYPHVKEVLEVGIAFSGKSVVAAYATYDLVDNQASDIILTNRYGQEASVDRYTS